MMARIGLAFIGFWIVFAKNSFFEPKQRQMAYAYFILGAESRMNKRAVTIHQTVMALL